MTVSVNKPRFLRLLRWYMNQLTIDLGPTAVLLATPANLQRLTEHLEKIRIRHGRVEPDSVWRVPVKASAALPVEGAALGAVEVTVDESRVPAGALEWVE